MFDLFIVHAFEGYMYGTVTLVVCRRHTGVVTVAWHRKASGGMSCVCCACGGPGPSSLMTSSMVFRSVQHDLCMCCMPERVDIKFFTSLDAFMQPACFTDDSLP